MLNHKLETWKGEWLQSSTHNPLNTWKEELMNYQPYPFTFSKYYYSSISNQ